MQLSAEIRWFWRTAPQSLLEDWFCKSDHHSCLAGGGQLRKDEYLRDSGDLELGIKRREGKSGIEIKGLIASSESQLAIGPFAGSVQVWGKWISTSLELDTSSLVVVEKQRWLRKFLTLALEPLEIPLDAEEQPLEESHYHTSRACCVDLTKVILSDSDVWWTFGFEAVGTLRTIEEDLRKVMMTMAERWQSAHLDGLQASYPAWLKEHAHKSLMAHV